MSEQQQAAQHVYIGASDGQPCTDPDCGVPKSAPVYQPDSSGAGSAPCFALNYRGERVAVSHPIFAADDDCSECRQLTAKNGDPLACGKHRGLAEVAFARWVVAEAERRRAEWLAMYDD